jgi:hypothetical protein
MIFSCPWVPTGWYYFVPRPWAHLPSSAIRRQEQQVKHRLDPGKVVLWRQSERLCIVMILRRSLSAKAALNIHGPREYRFTVQYSPSNTPNQQH